MKLTDEELVAAIEAEEAVAVDASDSTLSNERADAIARYRGELLGNEVEGRSAIVSKDLLDTIQWIMPSLVRIYLGGDDVVKVEPVGPEDEEAAERETAGINWHLQQKNDLYSVIVSTLTDALLLKNGYAFAYWSNNQDVRSETYTGLSDEEASMLASDPEVKVVEHTEYPDHLFQPPPPEALQQMAAQAMAQGQPFLPPQPPMLHDIKVERQYVDEYVGVDAIPPDEVIVSRRHRVTSLLNADFVQWRRRVTIGQLRAEGFKVPDNAQEYTDLTDERLVRQRYAFGSGEEDATGDITRKVVLCKDTYLKIDLQNEGKPQLWRVVIIDGMRIPILKEEADCIPVAAFSPIIYPHSHVGTSVYDLVNDLSLIKTVLQRQFVDGVFLQNSGRVAANVDQVNVDDLLISRPGGVVRVQGDPSSAIFPIVTPDAGPSILGALEYMEAVKEGRTGVTRYSAGLDANTLNKTATGIQQIQSAANQRIELIARTLASGFRDLFQIVHTLASKHSTKPIQIKLKGQWVPVDPRAWAKRTDFSISVGLGTGSPETQMQKLMLLGQVMQQGQALGVVGPEQFLNWFDDLCKAAGYKNPRRFSTEVQKDEQGKPITPPPPKPESVQAAEIKAQADLEGKKLEVQGKQIEQQHAGQMDMERMRGEWALQASNDEREIAKEKYKIDRQMELERFKAELQARVELEKAQIQAAAQQQAAAISVDGERQKAEVMVEGSSTQKAEKSQDRALLTELHKVVQELRELADAPREIVRGPDGRAAGVRVGEKVRMINRGPDGRATGLQ